MGGIAHKPALVSSHAIQKVNGKALRLPAGVRGPDFGISDSTPTYPCTAGFAARIPLKLARYCKNPSTHNTHATSPGAMPGESVRWKARMLYSSAASRVRARG